ncbi:MAG: hypothetical protein ABI190_03315 [Casimicrobiaceae bacterium]
MRFRRTLLSLLTWCLLFSQQAALAHGITHIRVDSPRASVSVGQVASSLSSDHGDEFCIECLAFAQVAGAAPNAIPDLAVEPACVIAPVAFVERTARSSPFLSFQARAPPFHP